MKRLMILLTTIVAFALGLGNMAQAGSVTVSGAASLTAAFTEIKEVFEKANPGTTVDTNFAASGTLLAQIEAGAPVDVFASADQETMDRAQAKNLLAPGTRRDFVVNALVLAKSKNSGRPAVASLKDLARPDITQVAMGSPDAVPAGRYAREALMAEKIWDQVQPKLIFGNNVKQVLDYVSRGEVDAGFVFATDAQTAGNSVEVVAQAPTKTPVRYPLAVILPAKDKPEVKAFVDFVLGQQGQAILAKYGFQKP